MRSVSVTGPLISVLFFKRYYGARLTLIFWLAVATKALTKYKRPKMKRDARQQCSLFLGCMYVTKFEKIVHLKFDVTSSVKF